MFKLRSKIEELFGIDLRGLAAFRVALALVYLCDLIVRATDLRALYTDEGILPRIAHLQTYQDPWFLSINMISGAAPIQILLFIIAGLAGAALLVGYRTRLATVIAWFLILSLDARNPIVLGEGVFIRILLFWGMFLPLGASYSIDRARNNSREKIPTRILSMATAALLLQVALIYFCAAGHKLKSVEWVNGTAIFNSLNYDPLVKPFGSSLLPYRELMKFVNDAVLGIEWGGAILLFCPVFTTPVRLIAILGFILFQLALWLCFELGPLVGSMIVAMIPFVPTPAWDYFVRKLTSSRWKVDYDWWSRFCKKILLKRSRPFLTFYPMKVKPSLLNTALVAISFLYVVISNASSFWNYRIPYTFSRFGGSMLWMNQDWTMFAPPPQSGGWNVIEGRQKNGISVDLFNEGKPLSWERPRLISKTFKSQLWRKYWMRIIEPGYEIPRAYYADYLCREWNAHRSGEDRLAEIELFQMQIDILPPDQVSQPYPVSYGKYPCA